MRDGQVKYLIGVFAPEFISAFKLQLKVSAARRATSGSVTLESLPAHHRRADGEIARDQLNRPLPSTLLKR